MDVVHIHQYLDIYMDSFLFVDIKKSYIFHIIC